MKNFILITSTLAAFACGSDSDSPKEAVNDVKQGFLNLVEQPAQQGGWTGPCESSDILNLSQKIEYAFLGNQLEKRVLLFEESDCKNVAAKARFKGEFKVDEKGEELYNLDSTYKSIEVMANNESLQNLFEGQTFCGQSEYKSGEWVEVTEVSGQGLCQFGKFPRTEYNVMKVSGNKMYLGNPLIVAASSEEERPSEVDESKDFTKTF